jgi:serine/threonine-protein kinase SRPK3
MMAKRALPFLARYASTMSRPLFPSRAIHSQNLPPHTPIEEELYRHYDPKIFYPVKPGELFHNSYETLVKLGFGSHSTVWLAKDLRK